MNEQAAHGTWVIVLSFVVALLFMLMSMPDWLRWLRPEWGTLVLVYWVMHLPHRVGLLSAFLLGLAIDVIEGAALGEHAFALAIVAYATYLMYQRLRMFALWQQSFLVLVLVGLQQLACHWVDNIMGLAQANLLFMVPALISAFFWPLVSSALQVLKRNFALA
jgi:rod shape-determining protein MreD